jgi:FMN phosphatase YigB (HAD superfamily)
VASQSSGGTGGPRIVCFDLGGVLVRIVRDWSEACRGAGLPVRGDPDGPAAVEARRQLMDLFGTGRITEDEWARRLAIALDGLYSVGDLMRIHHAWTLDEYAGAAALVDDLHAAGRATACLSNTNHSHWARLVHRDGDRARGGRPEYPAVSRLRKHFASHLFGLAKPDDAIYRAFEQATGLEGGEILFFDDLPENVAAARARGWRAERIDPEAETVPQLRRLLGLHGVL